MSFGFLAVTKACMFKSKRVECKSLIGTIGKAVNWRSNLKEWNVNC